VLAQCRSWIVANVSEDHSAEVLKIGSVSFNPRFMGTNPAKDNGFFKGNKNL
jgi:hypothetical protein